MDQQRVYIGEGRSAKVYLSEQNGLRIASKVFQGEGLSKLVLFILTGSANPYTWCQDAIASAFHRRHILTILCRYWFGQKLLLPETYAYRWAEAEQAFELDAEFITGSHVPLINPVDGFVEHAARRQAKEIMKPLQAKLIESGFDGLVWQAGKGNPVALSNFMCIRVDQKVDHWIWVDMESGVPALFALNPLSTLFYYIPKCLKHRGALFDDVDVNALNKYIDQHQQALKDICTEEEYLSFQEHVEELAVRQAAWKSVPRFRGSLLYAHSQGKISDEERDHYYTKPIRWYCRSLIYLIKALFIKSFAKTVSLLKAMVKFPYIYFCQTTMRYFFSSEYRWRFVRLFMRHQVKKWNKRGCLSKDAREFLLEELAKNRASAYLTDFSMHVGFKPFVKIVSWFFMPLLIASGYIDPVNGGLVILLLGPAVRTLYTAGRIVQNALMGKRYLPFIALFIGLWPVIGNLAFPIELLMKSSRDNNKLEKFIVYALTTKIGAKIPIWGGQDSGMEHFFNRWAYWIFR